MVSFLQLAGEKKTSFLVQLKQIFCPSYFDRALVGTGKSYSEELILASTNPQYDKRLLIELLFQYIKTTSSEHVVYINCSECQNKNIKTICLHNIFCPCNFHVLNW